MNCYRRNQRDEFMQRLAQEARILGEARMLRDDQDLTPELTEAVLKRLRDYMQRAAFSAERVARSIGHKSASLITEILAGSYAADPEPIIRKIDKWLEGQLLRENSPKSPGFVTTDAAKMMIGLAKRIHRIGGIGIITGPSGCGKTMTAEAIRSMIVGSVLIRITTAGASKRAILEQIAGELHLTGLKLTGFQIEQQIHRALGGGTRRLLIVDEAHKLIIKRKDESLHVLRDLHDRTECPLLLLGTANLATYIRNGKSEYEALDQISGRGLLWLDLTEKLTDVRGGGGGGTLHSIRDIREFLAAQEVKLVRDETQKPDEGLAMTDDAVAYIYEQVNLPFNGCMRTAKWLVLLARDEFREGVVTAEMLESLQAGRVGQKTVRAQRTEITLRQQQRIAAAG